MRYLKQGGRGKYPTLAMFSPNDSTGLTNLNSFRLPIIEFKKKIISFLKLCARSYLFICPRNRLGFLAKGTC